MSDTQTPEGAPVVVAQQSQTNIHQSLTNIQETNILVNQRITINEAARKAVHGAGHKLPKHPGTPHNADAPTKDTAQSPSSALIPHHDDINGNPRTTYVDGDASVVQVRDRSSGAYTTTVSSAKGTFTFHSDRGGLEGDRTITHGYGVEHRGIKVSAGVDDAYLSWLRAPQIACGKIPHQDKQWGELHNTQVDDLAQSEARNFFDAQPRLKDALRKENTPILFAKGGSMNVDELGQGQSKTKRWEVCPATTDALFELKPRDVGNVGQNTATTPLTITKSRH